MFEVKEEVRGRSEPEHNESDDSNRSSETGWSGTREG